MCQAASNQNLVISSFWFAINTMLLISVAGTLLFPFLSVNVALCFGGLVLPFDSDTVLLLLLLSNLTVAKLKRRATSNATTMYATKGAQVNMSEPPPFSGAFL